MTTPKPIESLDEILDAWELVANFRLEEDYEAALPMSELTKRLSAYITERERLARIDEVERIIVKVKYTDSDDLVNMKALRTYKKATSRLAQLQSKEQQDA